MTGRHRADPGTPRERAGGPLPDRTGPPALNPAAVPLLPLPVSAAAALPRPRPYVTAPAAVPGWYRHETAGTGWAPGAGDTADWIASYFRHQAPIVRSLVWAWYRDAAGPAETEFTAAIAGS